MTGRAPAIGRRFLALCVATALGVAGACSSDDPQESDPSETPGASGPTGEVTSATGDSVAAPSSGSTSSGSASETASSGPAQCLVRLHGKGETGAEPSTDGDTTTISPTGNADGWGGRQWLYFPDEEYTAARDVVAEAVDGCERIIVNGFSNGAAFAAKLYCRGETFDGRLVRVVVDDPVVDAGVIGCAPSSDVDVALYWTGGLESTATPGWDCAEGDWTCEGGETIGIEAYADALDVDAQESPFDDHQWYWDAPEVSQW